MHLVQRVTVSLQPNDLRITTQLEYPVTPNNTPKTQHIQRQQQQ
jgi:hypothetical protein